MRPDLRNPGGRLHRWRWARRHIRQMRAADGIIVSHTKSGRTWLRVMISHAYHLKYGVPEREIIKFDNLHKLNPAIPKLFFNRDTRIPSFSLIGGDVYLPRTKATLFVVRDPRDVAVSFFFHVRNRAGVGELDRKGITEEDRALDMFDFVTSEKLGVCRVIEHMNRWHYDMQRMPKALVIKYEEMRAQPEVALDQALTFLDRRFEPEIISRSVQFSSFESLSKKEAEGFFASGKLKPTNAENGDSYKVRRGKIGGYHDYFDDDQNAYIDSIVRDRLLPIYGYK